MTLLLFGQGSGSAFPSVMAGTGVMHDATVSTAATGVSKSVFPTAMLGTGTMFRPSTGRNAPTAFLMAGMGTMFDATVSNVTPVGAQIALSDSVSIQIALSDYA